MESVAGPPSHVIDMPPYDQPQRRSEPSPEHLIPSVARCQILCSVSGIAAFTFFSLNHMSGVSILTGSSGTGISHIYCVFSFVGTYYLLSKCY